MADPEPSPSPGPAVADPPAATAAPGVEPARWVQRASLVVLALAIVWAALVRIPLIQNARSHLDSDLGVDGLTLREAVNGHWHWHYPGTPYVGTFPVLFSWLQARVWGANPSTLVSGGTVAYVAVIAATFALALQTFGPAVALWTLVPLTFASTGVLWMSARITGGHITVVIWHALAFLMLQAALARGSMLRVTGLGVCCGFGFAIDSMFVLTMTGLVPAAFFWWWTSGRPRKALVAAIAFVPAFLAGIAPREFGARVEPYNAYPDQFAVSTDSSQLREHLRLLGLDCLPRLIAGHRLPDLQSDPDPQRLGYPGSRRPAPRDDSNLAIAATIIPLLLFLAAVRALADPESTRGDRAARSIQAGLIVSSIATLLAFVVNRNIYNADNYRYLTPLVVPWAIGFGLSMRSLVRLGLTGAATAAVASLALAAIMTLDTARWYHRFGWIDDSGFPVTKVVDDPALDWLERHPEVPIFFGDYWDVYRCCFLSRRPLRGIPFPYYPNRYPEWQESVPADRPQIVVTRPGRGSRMAEERVLQNGGEVMERGPNYAILSWPLTKGTR